MAKANYLAELHQFMQQTHRPDGNQGCLMTWAYSEPNSGYFIATVTLRNVDRAFTGSLQRGRKGAQQDAAKVALSYLREQRLISGPMLALTQPNRHQVLSPTSHLPPSAVPTQPLELASAFHPQPPPASLPLHQGQYYYCGEGQRLIPVGPSLKGIALSSSAPVDNETFSPPMASFSAAAPHAVLSPMTTPTFGPPERPRTFVAPEARALPFPAFVDPASTSLEFCDSLGHSLSSYLPELESDPSPSLSSESHPAQTVTTISVAHSPDPVTSSPLSPPIATGVDRQVVDAASFSSSSMALSSASSFMLSSGSSLSPIQMEQVREDVRQLLQLSKSASINYRTLLLQAVQKRGKLYSKIPPSLEWTVEKVPLNKFVAKIRIQLTADNSLSVKENPSKLFVKDFGGEPELSKDLAKESAAMAALAHFLVEMHDEMEGKHKPMQNPQTIAFSDGMTQVQSPSDGMTQVQSPSDGMGLLCVPASSSSSSSSSLAGAGNVHRPSPIVLTDRIQSSQWSQSLVSEESVEASSSSSLSLCSPSDLQLPVGSRPPVSFTGVPALSGPPPVSQLNALLQRGLRPTGSQGKLFVLKCIEVERGQFLGRVEFHQDFVDEGERKTAGPLGVTGETRASKKDAELSAVLLAVDLFGCGKLTIVGQKIREAYAVGCNRLLPPFGSASLPSASSQIMENPLVSNYYKPSRPLVSVVGQGSPEKEEEEEEEEEEQGQIEEGALGQSGDHQATRLHDSDTGWAVQDMEPEMSLEMTPGMTPGMPPGTVPENNGLRRSSAESDLQFDCTAIPVLTVPERRGGRKDSTSSPRRKIQKTDAPDAESIGDVVSNKDVRERAEEEKEEKEEQVVVRHSSGPVAEALTYDRTHCLMNTHIEDIDNSTATAAASNVMCRSVLPHSNHQQESLHPQQQQPLDLHPETNYSQEPTPIAEFKDVIRNYRVETNPLEQTLIKAFLDGLFKKQKDRTPEMMTSFQDLKDKRESLESCFQLCKLETFRPNRVAFWKSNPTDIDWTIHPSFLRPIDWPIVEGMDMEMAREDARSDAWLSDAKSPMYNNETHINDMAIARLLGQQYAEKMEAYHFQELKASSTKEFSCEELENFLEADPKWKRSFMASFRIDTEGATNKVCDTED